MDKLLKLARRRSGLATYERQHGARCSVPGSRENGEWSMLYRGMVDRLDAWRAGRRYGDEKDIPTAD